MAEIYNEMTQVGNLGAKPEIKFFESGNAVVQFNIAIYQGKDRSGQPNPSTWITVKAWDNPEKGGQYLSLADTLDKGTKVRVVGKLNHDEWTDKTTGAKRTKYYIELRHQFDNHGIQIIPKPGDKIANYDDSPF